MLRMTHMPRASVLAAAASALLLAACGSAETGTADGEVTRRDPTGTIYTVGDTVIDATFAAAGVAAPMRQATMSTTLMASVTEVLVREGDAVVAGQPLVRIDARDLAARASRVAASIAEAESMHGDAETQAGRIRGLYADSAATRAQLDAAESGLARARAALRAARAAGMELDAVRAYSVITAPFAGRVTKRFVDPGAFAAPGAPLVTVQDASQLRITASVTPEAARSLRPGQSLAASIEGEVARAVVEGVVPASAGNLYSVNALVSNPRGSFLAGSAAILELPVATRTALVVPAGAVTRQGDLTGVTLRTAQGDALHWVRLGARAGTSVEVTAGLRAGDRVVVPAQVTPAGSN